MGLLAAPRIRATQTLGRGHLPVHPLRRESDPLHAISGVQSRKQAEQGRPGQGHRVVPVASSLAGSHEASHVGPSALGTQARSYITRRDDPARGQDLCRPNLEPLGCSSSCRLSGLLRRCGIRSSEFEIAYQV